MGWVKPRTLVAFAIAGASMASTGLTSCGGDDASMNATDATYGSAFQDAVSTSETSAPIACAPVLSDAWTPPPFEPPVMDNASCTTQMVQDFYNECFSPTQLAAACNALYSAPDNAACMACLYTPFGKAPPRGAILAQENGLVQVNYSGCIALVDGDFSDTGCGALVQALATCENDSCNDTCPIDTSSTVSEDASLKAFNACISKADKTTCLSERAAAVCATDAKYARCKFSGFEAYAIGIGDFMCASGTVDDAGISDAADDAADADLDAADAE